MSLGRPRSMDPFSWEELHLKRRSQGKEHRGVTYVDGTQQRSRSCSWCNSRRAVNEMFDALERDVMVPWGGHQGYPPQRGPFPPSYGSEYGVSLDMHETPEGFELSADLPGMRREDISVDVDNDTRVLTVSAERKNAQGADDNGFNSQRRVHYRERSFGKMSRSIRLPEMADVTRAGATYTDGVLTLTFPRLRPLPSGRTHIPVGSGTVGGQLPIAEGPPAETFTRELPPPAGSPLALPPTEGYGTLALPDGSFQR